MSQEIALELQNELRRFTAENHRIESLVHGTAEQQQNAERLFRSISLEKMIEELQIATQSQDGEQVRIA